MRLHRYFLGAFLQALLTMACLGQSGGVRGVLVDAETKQPLIGANILLQPSERGTITNEHGVFEFLNVPVGTYVLRFSYLGFETLFVSDVVVRVGRTANVTAELQPVILESEGIEVSAGYFQRDDAQPVSVATFSAEEVRRTAGAGGDISRIINGLPGMARVDDMRNSLVVRGGSPMENGFFVDNIAIPNINHFPTQGSSGGPIGLINVDLIDDVSFSAGGFSAAYGDRLSSVMEIQLREGNRESSEYQFDLNFAGVGLVAEGGLAEEQGAWLISARRSYLDFLIDTVFKDEAGAALPVYSDYQAKLTYDLNDRDKITFLDILGLDESNIEQADALEEAENYFGSWKNAENTVGVNWRHLWRGNGVSNTSLSHAFTRYDISTSRTATGDALYANRSSEHHVRLRNTNYYRLSEAHHLEFGADVDLQRAGYDQRYAAGVDPLGQTLPLTVVDESFTSWRAGVYASYRWKPLWRFSTTIGVRMDRFSYTKQTLFAPRFAASLNLTAKTALNTAFGLYHQQLPLVLLTQSPTNRSLQNPLALHMIVGIQHMLAEHTRLSIEAYSKLYDQFPIDPSQGALFIIDQLFYDQNVYQQHAALIDDGKARTRGVEIMVQKKLARKIYGLISAAYFRSQYRDASGAWRNRVFDNRLVFSTEGGFKPDEKHEFSLRWTYAGGRPYTPFDVDASREQGQGVFDISRINAVRMPDYHSLSLRFDRRFYLKRSTLIAYLSVWNVYGRRNTAGFFWNEVENQPESIEQWGTLPIFGLELEL